MDHDIMYDYTLLFSKTCSIDNPINTKPRFQKTFQRLDARKKLEREVQHVHIEKDYIDQLIKNIQPLSFYSYSHA